MSKHESLIPLIEKIKKNDDWERYLEKATRAYIINPILGELGWDLENTNEVIDPCPTGLGEVDYGLKTKNFIIPLEAKSTKEELDKHQWQLLLYLFELGAPIGVLSNGICWWFYLPMESVPWNERKFLEINLLKDTAEHSAKNLYKFLSRNKCQNAEYILNANNELKKKNLIFDGFTSEHRSKPFWVKTNYESKLRIQYDALRQNWCRVYELYFISGLRGGWQKYVYKHFVKETKYKEVVKLLQKDKYIRLATEKESKQWMRGNPAIIIYGP